MPVPTPSIQDHNLQGPQPCTCATGADAGGPAAAPVGSLLSSETPQAAAPSGYDPAHSTYQPQPSIRSLYNAPSSSASGPTGPAMSQRDPATPSAAAAAADLPAADTTGPAAPSSTAADRPTLTGVVKDMLSFALPMLATLAADPLASLVDTAAVGRLGSIPLAGVGLAVSIFNSVTRLANAPLLAVTTSAIAMAQAATAALESSSDATAAAVTVASEGTLTTQQSSAVTGLTEGDEQQQGDSTQLPRVTPYQAAGVQQQHVVPTDGIDKLSRALQQAPLQAGSCHEQQQSHQIEVQQPWGVLQATSVAGCSSSPSSLHHPCSSPSSYFGSSDDVVLLMDTQPDSPMAAAAAADPMYISPIPSPKTAMLGPAGPGYTAGSATSPPAAAWLPGSPAVCGKEHDSCQHCSSNAASDTPGSGGISRSPSFLQRLLGPGWRSSRQPAADELPGPASDPSSPLAAAEQAVAGRRVFSPVEQAVSSCLMLAVLFGTLQGVLLVTTAGNTTQLWGAPSSSPLFQPAVTFLTLRGCFAPVTVLLLVTQGVYRGLRDTLTPLWATIGANALNVALLPPLVFAPLHWGVAGSAAATGISQAVPFTALVAALVVRYRLGLSPRAVALPQLVALFAPTGLLVLRTASVSAVYAVATGVVARGGPIAAAGHQVAFQIWLAASLLADSLAVASQTLVAAAAAAGQLPRARLVVRASLLLALTLGSLLGLLLACGSRTLPLLFSSDKQVQAVATRLMPLVAITQPLNAVAFVLDGVLYGVGGFRFASGVMLVCAAPSLALMLTGLALQRPRVPIVAPPQGLLAPHILQAHQLVAGDPWSWSNTLVPLWSQGQLCSSCAPASICAPGSYSFLHSNATSWMQLVHPAAQDWQPGSTSSQPATAVHALLSSVHPGDRLIGSAVAEDAASMTLVWWAWAGLVLLMAMRSLTIYLPYLLRTYPFTPLFKDKPRTAMGARMQYCLNKVRSKLHGLLQSAAAARRRRRPVADVADAALAEPLL